LGKNKNKNKNKNSFHVDWAWWRCCCLPLLDALFLVSVGELKHDRAHCLPLSITTLTWKCHFSLQIMFLVIDMKDPEFAMPMLAVYGLDAKKPLVRYQAFCSGSDLVTVWWIILPKKLMIWMHIAPALVANDRDCTNVSCNGNVTLKICYLHFTPLSPSLTFTYF